MIMVIDDSPTIRTICKVALGRAGYDIDLYADCISAMRALRAPEALLPELILLDLVLPKANGFTFLRHLKQNPLLSNIPIVILSRSCGIVPRVHAGVLGVKTFLTKPVTTTQLVDAVRQFRREASDARAAS